jgi:hypothetical protein
MIAQGGFTTVNPPFLLTAGNGHRLTAQRIKENFLIPNSQYTPSEKAVNVALFSDDMSERNVIVRIERKVCNDLLFKG